MLSQEELINHQLSLENTMSLDGRTKYLRTQERIGDDLGAGSMDSSSIIIKGCLGAVTSSLKSPKGTMTAPRYYISLLDPEIVALAALHEAFNAAREITTLNKVVSRMGQAVHSEVWAKALSEHDKKLYTRLVLRATRTHGSVVHRKKAIRATAQKEGYKPLPWAEDILASIGGVLLNAVLEGCPDLFEVYTYYGKAPKTYPCLGVTPEGLELIESLTERSSWLTPTFRPMVVKPRPWVSVSDGGYLSSQLVSRTSLVRANDTEVLKSIQGAIDDGSMAPCINGLNIVQETAWAINKPLLEVVKWAWENNMPLEGFPVAHHLPKPTHPSNWEELNDQQKKAWRIKASQIITRNRGIDGDRVTMSQDLGVAQTLCDYERFYLPHNLDFRGRVYPIPSFNHQRADHIRALFRFAKGTPIGDDGAYWLAIHLANCGDFGGVSKRSLDERFEWTVDNEQLIRGIAGSPSSTYALWSGADKPFQFIAACIEYNRFLEEGVSALCFIAPALDGSNSGLQHYSASLRSPEGSLVNLTPQDTPADLYQAVADILVTDVARDVALGDALAKTVQDNGIKRKLVKRNAMTFSYSSGEYGFKQQHMEDLMKPLALKVLSGELPEHPYGPDGGFAAAGYIAKKVHLAITGLVKDAVGGMKFFQRCAAALAHEGKGLTWKTPVGLPVTHKYTEWDHKRVRLFLHDKSIPVLDIEENSDTTRNNSLREVRLLIQTKPNSRINKAKAKSAVSPNVIHSMDGAHLLLTVLKAHEKGVTDFSLIHDSFGTHASYTSEFFYDIREAFIEMYETYCPYEVISKATYTALDDKSKLPPQPQKGTLDVNAIYNSLYAFV